MPDLLEREIAPNLRVAKRWLKNYEPEVWDVLRRSGKR